MAKPVLALPYFNSIQQILLYKVTLPHFTKVVWLHTFIFIFTSMSRHDTEHVLHLFLSFSLQEPRQDEHNTANVAPDGGLPLDSPASPASVVAAETGAAGKTMGVVSDVDGMGLCRIMVLVFVERVMHDCCKDGDLPATGSLSGALLASLRQLSDNLLQLNLRTDFVSAAMIGSELFGMKLRCWQVRRFMFALPCELYIILANMTDV